MTRRIPRHPSAFTIVELLVVIAIIGTLVALLIPAVQMARESGRRSMCTSNMHQLAIAAQRHEEIFGTMPPGLPNCVDQSKFGLATGVNGGAWCQGPNWAIALLPYLEEQVMFDTIKNCTDGRYNTCDDCTAGVAAPPMFLCPSAEFFDSTFSFTNSTMAGANDPGPSNILKGNYAANFGSDTYLSYKFPATAGAFDIVDVRGLRGSTVNQAKNDPSMMGNWKLGSKLGVKLASVSDGTSTTILLSEVLGYPGAADNRGAWTFGGMGGSVFTTRLTPNSLLSDVVPSCQKDPSMPTIYQFNCSIGTDPIPAAPPAGTYAAARSAHSGNGVVVVMVDGSTHYMASEIDPMVWQNLGTRRAGIVVEMPPD